MNDQLKSAIDVASLGVAGATVLEYLPAAAAAASLVGAIGRMIGWACRRWRLRK